MTGAEDHKQLLRFEQPVQPRSESAPARGCLKHMTDDECERLMKKNYERIELYVYVYRCVLK